MLFKDTITAVKGLNGPSAGVLVLNTNRIGLYKVRATTKSDYFYSLNQYDRREKPLFFQSSSAVATLTSALDTVLNSNVYAMPVFPDDDITQTPVTKYLNYEDFAYAVAHETHPNLYSWVYYVSKAFKLHRVLVNHSLDRIIDVAATGTTTTTTSTTTTSTTTTSTSTTA